MLFPFGTSVFFLLIVMAVVDVIGSLAVSMQSRRRVVRQAAPASVWKPAPTPAAHIEPVIIPPAPAAPMEVHTEPEATPSPQPQVITAGDASITRSPYTPDASSNTFKTNADNQAHF